jgi:hypothetical protein
MTAIAAGARPLYFLPRAMNNEVSLCSGWRPARWLGIFALLLLFVALRWNNFNVPLIRDEGEYAYAAQLLIHGGIPYEQAFVQKPPMVIYSYALAQLLLPGVFWAPRLLANVFVALATLLLGCVARKEFGSGVAWLTMLLVTPMILLPGLDQFPANTEMFLLLPMLATFAIYVHARHCGQKTIYWLAAGFFGVTALCCKYTALPPIAFVFVVWAVESWRQTRDMRTLLKFFLAVALGGALAAILELGFFLIHDGGARLWECTVLFNRLYLHSSTFGHRWLWCGIFWSNWWVLFLMPWAIFLRPPCRIGFWLGAFISAVVATSASAYGQYYIVLMPFWALMAAVGIRAMALRLGGGSDQSSQRITGLIAILVLVLLLRPDLTWLTSSHARFLEERINCYPFGGSLTVARRVEELSGPDDFVYVAGSEPQILFYAQRYSPTRFITAYALMIPTVMAEQYQHEAMAALVRHPPKLIVYSLDKTSWLRQTDSPTDFQDFLGQFLRRNYLLVGGFLPDRPNSWTEPLSTNDMAGANLLLFQRKPSP